jgi:pentose-5-phosphate-3-epimerase
MKIVPAILEKEFDNVIDLLTKYKSFTDEIQIDVCDGEFVDSLTWIPNHLEDIDPAAIRPGRVDYILELKNATVDSSGFKTK